MRLERCDLCHRRTLRGLTEVAASNKDGPCMIRIEGEEYGSIHICRKCRGAMVRALGESGLTMKEAGD